MSSVNAAQLNDATYRLAPMVEHDLLEVVEIEEASGLSRWGWDGYHYELARTGETVMLVARLSNATKNFPPEQRIAGFIAARLGVGELHINNVAVRGAFRQRGIGAALLVRALEEGRQHGAQRALLEVRAANRAAQSLYERQGFRITVRRKNYYVAPSDDALVMAMEI